MSEEKQDLVIFGDSTGRHIVGRQVSLEDGVLTVANPAVFTIQAHPQNPQQAVLQLAPFFYAEFSKNEFVKEPIIWKWNTDSLVVNTNLELSDQVVNQYEATYEGAKPMGQQTPEASTDVDDGEEIIVFSEEDES